MTDSSKRSLAFLAGVYLLAFGLASHGLSPPPPVPESSASNSFSAERAMKELTALLGDGAPHPVGSSANAAVRERLVAALEARGLWPRVERSMRCTPRGLCVEIANVVAALDPRADNILLAAHYDSVAAGPGAGDDMSGVATILDVASVLPARTKNGVVLLFTDGEEAGLLGAEAFVERDPLAASIRVAINIEARGSGGPSLMFESAGATASLAPLLANMPHPVTSSLFSAVYERLPNDTDFTIFARHGMAGFNFAFIDDVAHYHTAIDDLAHLDPASVQHHGDNVLALTTALLDSDLRAHQGSERAVWFDLLGKWLIGWPEPWSLPLALIALALVLAAALADRKRDLAGVAAHLGTTLAVVAATIACGFGLVALVADGGSTMGRYTHLTLPVAALAGAAAAVVFALGSRTAVSTRARFAAVWLLWAGGGVALAVLLPAASYLLIAPTLVAGALGIVSARAPDASWIAASWPSLGAGFFAALMWLAIALGLVQGVGLMGHPAIAAMFALVATTALPVLHGVRFRVALSCGGFALACAAATHLVPVYDAIHPQRMSIVHHQRDEEPDASWWIDTSWGELPDALAAVAPTQVDPPLPWVGFTRAREGRAPRIDANAPRVERVRRDEHGGRYRLIGSRDAAALGMVFSRDARIGAVRIDGVRAALPELRHGPWQGQRFVVIVSDTAVDLDIEHGPDAPMVELFDVVRGAPAVAEALLSARAPSGVPSQDGDMSIASRRVALP